MVGAAPSLAINIGPLATPETGAAAALHRQGLSDTLNSRLGLIHLMRLYSVTAADPNSFVATAHIEGELAGVVSSTLDPERLSALLRSELSTTSWLRIAAKLIGHPRSLLELIETTTLLRPPNYRGQPVRPCLTSIVVSPAHGRRGIGLALVEAVDAFVRSHGLPAYRLDTRVTNAPAVAFYRKHGFIEAERRGRNIIFVRVLSQ